jgi:cysteine-rich repeat protein
MKFGKIKSILMMTAIGVFAIAGFALAQSDLGLNAFAQQTALGTRSLPEIIANIVRIFLSVLGVLTVLLILYAGFLWMTSAGDAKKVALAKKIIINAVIGLAIILSSLALTQYIIGRLSEATGTNIGGPGGPGGGGGGLPGDSFIVRGVSPQGSVPIRNITVRISFSHAVETSTVNGNILIVKQSDNSIAPYTFAVSGDRIDLTSSLSCGALNADVFCFEVNTAYRLQISSGLHDTAGNSLLCGGIAPSCTVNFATGNLVDTQPPQVAITYPDAGQSVPQNSTINVWARATDDAGVSHIDFFGDGAIIGGKYPIGVSPRQYDGNISWSTTGVALGNHNLSARGYDINSGATQSADVPVTVRAAHCFNAARDVDETGIDCGGADCAACTGGQCAQNSDCVSGSCQNGICVDTPVILDMSPSDGAAGTYVTLRGQYFGTSGVVTFLGRAGAADDRIAQLAPCANAWTNTAATVLVPAGTVTGPVEIRNTIGSDTTSDVRGPALADFIVNTLARPGICQLTPNQGRSGTSFRIEGDGFGGSQGTSFVRFGNVFATPSAWTNAAVTAVAPVLQPGDNSVAVNRGGADSNAVPFTVLSPLAGTRPVINYADPATGPVGEYVTIFGTDFGTLAGTVEFVRADGVRATGDTSFPSACPVDYWHNTYIIVKAPAAFSDGATTRGVATSIQVRRQDGAVSNVVSFNINTAAPKPGICALRPDNGPIGTPVDIVGERFGNSGTINFYNRQAGQPVSWSDVLVRVPVPNGAITGPVVITTAQSSNGANFTVGDCRITPTLCGTADQCCRGSCISKSAQCAAAPQAGAYAWRISTGIIPKVPRVVEDCSTGPTAADPSPSPWDTRPGGNTACVNAIVNIRFNTKLNPASAVFTGVATDTIALYRCTGSAPNVCATKTKVVLSYPSSRLFAVSGSEDGVKLYPSGGFVRDTQYLVELGTGIKAAGTGGGNMEANSACGSGIAYCFKFKTANSDGLCTIGSAVVSPGDFIAVELGQQIDYSVGLRSKDDVCLDINGSGYTYNWSSSQSSNAGVTRTGFNVAGQAIAEAAVVTALNETTVGTPAIITFKIPGENVQGQANLSINFADPIVVNKWPACDSACINGLIAADFNIPMNSATLSGASMQVFSCRTENCDTFDGQLTGAVAYSAADKRVSFTPSSPLAINKFYFVRLDTLIIRSFSNVGLTGANSTHYYTWQFRTRNDATPCGIKSVSVTPSAQIFNYVGQNIPYNAVPVGAPDSCSPAGQILNASSYNWGWLAANTEVPQGVAAGYRVVNLLNNGASNVLPVKTAGCNEMCLHTGSAPKVSVCGNNVLEKGEDCDDGNAVNGDGCSNRCLAEGTSAPTCGNGRIDRGENCDDRNVVSGDGCSNRCLAEGSAAGKSICGNGAVGRGEVCDDNNSVSGDGCSSDCLNEGTMPNISSCGNNRKEAGEDCDDGNVVSGDGCSSVCFNEGSIFVGSASKCGNGAVEKGEDCDDGNMVSSDGCSANCLKEGSNLNYVAGSLCGNNLVQTGEECDGPVGDAFIDPRQYAIAIGKGKSNISAAANGVTGNVSVEVACVYTADAQCPAIVGRSFGVGADNCCYERAQVVASLPSSGQTNVCRNALLSVTFNQSMDVAGGALTISERKSGACPAGTSATSDGLWCNYVNAGAVSSSVMKVSRTVTEDVLLGRTKFDFNLSALLKSDTQYRIAAQGFKNKQNVSAADYSWQFTTGGNVCSFDRAVILPSSLEFDKVETKQAIVAAQTFDGQTLSAIPGVYDWVWSWTTSPNKVITLAAGGLPTAQNITAKAQNGEENLMAQAKITMDIYKLNAANPVVSGNARAIVMLCENPWPARAADGSWSPYVNVQNNFSTYYCRDTGGTCKAVGGGKLACTNGGKTCGNDVDCLLPNLGVVAATLSPNVIAGGEILFPDSVTGDALGLRVYSNIGHLSPLSWYKSQAFAGNPQPATVDGYPAIVDGRSTYVNAANYNGPASLYTNIFVLSYNQGSSADMQKVRDQIVSNWKFNVNLQTQNIEACQTSRKRCVADADCNAGDTCQSGQCSATLGRVCSSDFDCDAGDACQAVKLKLARDVKRLGDFNDIAALLEAYRTNTGAYPTLLAGSFLKGFTVSPWSSWQAALGNAVGAGLPVDPLNKHAVCNVNAIGGIVGYWKMDEAAWNGAIGEVKDAGGNGLDGTKTGGSNTVAGAVGRAGSFANLSSSVSAADSDLLDLTGNLTVSAWIKTAATDGGIFRHYNITTPFTGYGMAISGRELSFWSSDRGAWVSSGRAVNDNNWHLVTATLSGNVLTFYVDGILVRAVSGVNPPAQGSIASAFIGDNYIGLIDDLRVYNRALTPQEVRLLNTIIASASYDGTSCWDGVSGQYFCPAGSHVYQYQARSQTDYRLSSDFEFNNGAGWNGPLAANMNLVNVCVNNTVSGAATCGDGAVGPGEDCERGQTNLQTCTAGNRSGNRVLTCDADCHWDLTAVCQVGQCGDGIKQTGEACDDGQNNGRYGFCNASCTGRSSFCGDNVTDTSSEECDAGALNGQYNSGCSWDCKKPGLKCGDGLVSGAEQCDGNSEIRKTDGNSAACPVVNGYQTQQIHSCGVACAWNSWTACLPIGVCGNGVKEGSEQCDDGNGDNNDGCTNVCKPAVCGDNFVQSGAELCDNGASNGTPCVIGNGLTCSYCSTSCSIVTQTGAFCGDGVKSGSESCDGGDFGGKTCKDFGYFSFLSGRLAASAPLICDSGCSVNISRCVSIFRMNSGGPVLTDADGNFWNSDSIPTAAGESWTIGQRNDLFPNAGSATTISSGRGTLPAATAALYMTARAGSGDFPLVYSFNVPSGAYRIKLYFAETTIGFYGNLKTSNAKRVFNVALNKNVVERNIDLVAQAGGVARVLTKEYVANAPNNFLTLELIRVVQENPSIATWGAPILNAVEIEPLSGGSATPAACNPGTCLSLGFNCGTAQDGCGSQLNCGICSAAQNVCTANRCVCQPTPQATACAGRACGSASNGCGGQIACGSCTGNNICNASNQCVPACSNVCTSGARQCSGTTGYQTCATGASGCTEWSAVTACGAMQACSGGVCVSTCGNGVINAGEYCDDGALNGRPNQCNSTCTYKLNVSSVSPNSGPPGTLIAIVGNGFGASPTGRTCTGQVQFSVGAGSGTGGWDSATWSDKRITVRIPAGFSAGNHTVGILQCATQPPGTSNTQNFNVIP